jgi:hypothetical protein
MHNNQINHEAEIARLNLERKYLLAGTEVQNALTITVELMDINALIANHTAVRLCECIMNNNQ